MPHPLGEEPGDPGFDRSERVSSGRGHHALNGDGGDDGVLGGGDGHQQIRGVAAPRCGKQPIGRSRLGGYSIENALPPRPLALDPLEDVTSTRFGEQELDRSRRHLRHAGRQAPGDALAVVYEEGCRQFDYQLIGKGGLPRFRAQRGHAVDAHTELVGHGEGGEVGTVEHEGIDQSELAEPGNGKKQILRQHRHRRRSVGSGREEGEGDIGAVSDDQEQRSRVTR